MSLKTTPGGTANVSPFCSQPVARPSSAILRQIGRAATAPLWPEPSERFWS